MSVVVVRNGIMAADTRVTTHSEEGGTRVFKCHKIYGAADGSVVGVVGDGFSALVFLDWYNATVENSRKKPPEKLVTGDADFSALVLRENGTVLEYDKWCVPDEILMPEGFYALGCGAKAALGALHMGATAEEAVKVACKIDPFCAEPVEVLRPGKPK